MTPSKLTALHQGTFAEITTRDGATHFGEVGAIYHDVVTLFLAPMLEEQVELALGDITSVQMWGGA
jgi:hypothetical protein